MSKNFPKIKKIESFYAFNDYSSNGISYTLSQMAGGNRPVVICIGSDLVLGDSLGPIVGTMLKNKKINAYVYGTLGMPITAKEVPILNKFLGTSHPNSVVIAVDAAVGEESDVGMLRVVNGGLKPGLGVDKNLGTVGDISVIGIVAKKSPKNQDLFSFTRLGLVYKMAEKIALGIEGFIGGISKIKNVPKSISL